MPAPVWPLMTDRGTRATIDLVSTTRTAGNPLAFSRRSDRRVFLGVAGGFADEHGVDVLVVRAAIVVLCFAGGLGVVLYVLGHLLADDAAPSRVHARPIDQRRNLAVAAVALGA
ncbi:MAG: hypothetical protein JWN39_1704, partial [Ilumatobacteraceae bacterium]|nr:hypothetical protein [Ilumatobacteraceae bacterium]